MERNETRTFSTVVLPLLGDLRRRARTHCPLAADAEDLVQDTLEKALRHFATLRPDSNAWAWLVTIMYHQFVDGCRRRRRHEALPEQDLPAPEPESPEPHPPWTALEPAHVDQALAGMAGPFREILELRWREHCTYKEISTRLGIPMATVGTRLMRGRRQLRTVLDRAA